MLNAYHRWNIFERTFFWHNNIAIAVLMVGSVAISSFNFLETPYKLGVITSLIIGYGLYRKYLWEKLESMEKIWQHGI